MVSKAPNIQCIRKYTVGDQPGNDACLSFGNDWACVESIDLTPRRAEKQTHCTGRTGRTWPSPSARPSTQQINSGIRARDDDDDDGRGDTLISLCVRACSASVPPRPRPGYRTACIVRYVYRRRVHSLLPRRYDAAEENANRRGIQELNDSKRRNELLKDRARPTRVIAPSRVQFLRRRRLRRR